MFHYNKHLKKIITIIGLFICPFWIFCQEELAEAYEKIDSLEKVLVTLPEDTTRLPILEELAIDYSSLLQDSMLLKYAENHLKIALNWNHIDGITDFYSSLLPDYMYSFPDLFKIRQQEGYKYFSVMKDTVGLVNLKISDAQYAKTINNYSEAIQILEFVDSLYQTMQYTELNELIYTDLALLMSDTRNIEASMKYVEKTLLLDTIYDVANKALAGLIKAENLFSLGLMDSVEYFAKSALTIYLKIGDSQFIEKSYSLLGDYSMEIGAINKAKDYYKKVEALAAENKCACTYLGAKYFSLGKYYYDLAHYDSARIFFQKDIQQSLLEKDFDVNSNLYSSKSHQYLSEIYEKEGYYQTALQHYKQYQFLSDSLLRLDNNKTLKEFNIKYETKEKEQEILLLNKDNELLNVRNQNYIIAATGIGLIALITLGFFFNIRRKNQQINQQKSQLEQLNTTKDQLFSIISHDLRRPALAFRGISEKVNYLVRRKDFNRLHKFGEGLEKSAFSLNALLDNLLNWALTQRNVLTLKPQLVNISRVLEEVFDLLHPFAKEKNIDLKVDLPSTIQAFVDPNALVMIIRNLLDNAIKFTPSRGQIMLSGKAKTKDLMLVMKDNGIGMNTDQLAHIFDLFKEKSTSGTNNEKGTGLGLNLVKDLVELSNGKIQVQSKEGEGTKFEILLPLISKNS